MAPDFPSFSLKEQQEASSQGFLTWLSLIPGWISIHSKRQVSIYGALVDDHTVFDFLGVYSTTEVLALAGTVHDMYWLSLLKE